MWTTSSSAEREVSQSQETEKGRIISAIDNNLEPDSRKSYKIT